MRTQELDFPLPAHLIAQQPVEPRDACRLLHLRKDGVTAHHVFRELPTLLHPGDLLVLNDSRVLPARVQARKPSGGAVELLFLRPEGVQAEVTSRREPTRGESNREESVQGERWEALARPSHRLRAGLSLLVGSDELVLEARLGEGRWIIAGAPGRSLVSLMEEHGKMPLPPYIREQPADPSSYQTVYAAVPGSAAAPTAGLHFTPRLLEELAQSGVEVAYVTLHVGLDTFQPIREEVVEQHRIHREAYSVPAVTLAAVQRARREGRRVVAVGTTVTRVLETLAQQKLLHKSGDLAGFTDIFITPGYRFRVVDALLTNFHLPRSTVLALVMAFAGMQRIREAYAVAVANEYRFFSFGDAMLIDKPAADADRRNEEALP
ncbi:MAG: tRNA preQ1(34) S-adenosylmethionine ribosyltransferase-isomerase QueA [Thermoleophilia bacterium]|nr:tRNA preQ1(34) S-adenosylmethionine ribosyltransferase-isomerase QueA [Thermoleophilia bacterium]